MIQVYPYMNSAGNLFWKVFVNTGYKAYSIEFIEELDDLSEWISIGINDIRG